MTYAVFLKHLKTGETAVIHSPGASSQDAVDRISPALGDGWKAKGALQRKPQSEPTAPPQAKFRIVTFAQGPTPQMLNETFGPWDIMKKLTPHYAVFDLKALWSFDYGAKAPGHFICLWKQMVLNDKDEWAYMSWEYNLGLEGVLQKVYRNKHGHLVYAVYEKVLSHGYGNSCSLYKLAATRDV